MQFINDYQNYKLEVKATIPGSLSNFLYAYCKTLNCPQRLEPHYIRKAVSFVKIARNVRLNITNDFDLWYRKNEDSPELMQVLSNIINIDDNRTQIYSNIHYPEKQVSQPFYITGFNLPMVLVSK